MRGPFGHGSIIWKFNLVFALMTFYYSPNPMGSSRSLSSSPPENEPEVSSHTSRQQPVELQQVPISHRGLPLPTPVMGDSNTKSTGNIINPPLPSPRRGSSEGVSPQQQSSSEDNPPVLSVGEQYCSSLGYSVILTLSIF